MARAGFIIGAKKAGTTFLASLLGQHPEVLVATPKEPRIFLEPRDRIAECWSEYFGHAGNRVCIDASVGYSVLAHPAFKPNCGREQPVPQLIREEFSEARIVFIVRDPVERLFSDYLHDLRFAASRPQFHAWLNAHPEAILRSRYDLQLDRYLEIFPKHQIQVIDFDRLRSDTSTVCVETLKFLGADPSRLEFGEPEKEKANRHEAFLLPRPIAMLSNLVGENRIRLVAEASRSLMPSWSRSFLKRLSSSSAHLPTLSDRDYESIAERFQDTVDYLDRNYGLTNVMRESPG